MVFTRTFDGRSNFPIAGRGEICFIVPSEIGRQLVPVEKAEALIAASQFAESCSFSSTKGTVRSYVVTVYPTVADEVQGLLVAALESARYALKSREPDSDKEKSSQDSRDYAPQQLKLNTNTP